MNNNTSTCIIELSELEINELYDLSNQINMSPSEKPELFCKKANQLSRKIPERIKNILLNFAKNGSETGFLLIKGFPLNDETLPKTPSNNNKIGETTILARIQAILINILGDMISYEAEGCGRLFQDIVPIKNMSDVQTSTSSNYNLEMHNEQAFSKLRPDILSLACIRSDPNAFTYLLPVKSIINNLSVEDQQILYKPLWNIGVDLSFQVNKYKFIDGDIRGPIPILKDEIIDPKIVFDYDLMKGKNDVANIMIKKIYDIYNKYRIEHNLQQGEILFIDNNRSLHGRSCFQPNYDGNDRFLVRCFATFNLEKSAYARKGRMIKAIYS
jgi:L-asparagine oxygenase